MKLDPEEMRKFEETTLLLSTPKERTYRKFLDFQTINSKISPPSANVKIVTDFLEANGIEISSDTQHTVSSNYAKVSGLSTTIQVHMHGKIAEQMFRAQFVQYRHVFQRDVSIFRVGSTYSLPKSVANVVAYVDDIVRYPAIEQPLVTYGHENPPLYKKPQDPYHSCGDKCYGFTTPSVLKEMYKYDSAPSAPNHPRNGVYNGLSIVSFAPKSYNSDVISDFNQMCNVPYTYSIVDNGRGHSDNICGKFVYTAGSYSIYLYIFVSFVAIHTRT